MKKTLLTAMLFLAGLGANAQLADGSVAPDFTATDINGVSHTLSEYLNAGKTVIIDISATWCGPCWNYHHTGALEDIYDAYGEGGSDEIVVLFIEGDPGTSVSSIYGVNVASDVSTTQGDWTIGSPYPIIDDGDGSISDSYEIAYFPTVYRICPAGTTLLIDQKTAAQIKTSVNSGCGALTGEQNYAKTTTTDVRTCETSAVAKAKVKNYGINQITSATVVVEQNGAAVATKNYTGALNQFSTATITFDSAEFDASLDYDVRVTNINGATPFNPSLAIADLNVIHASEASNNITVRCYTDHYPTEISWQIKDSNGAVVASGGPYTGSANGGGAQADMMIESAWTLPMPIDCYTVVYKDAYGDGWSLGTTQHGIEIVASQGIVYSYNPGNFGTTLTVDAAFKTTGTLSNPGVEAKKFAVYPNPTTGILNFSTPEALDVTVTDITGKVVYTAKNINDGGSINLNSLQKGMYIAQVKGATTQTTQKIIVD